MKDLIDSVNVEEIQKYIEKKDNVKLNLKKQNLLECVKKGHEPHYDTGTSNHMTWCRYSASTLLTNDFQGGEFSFVDKDNNILETFDKNKHFNKTLVFDVSNKHKVNPHYDGDRKVNLYFWECVENIKLSDDNKEWIENNKN